LSSSGSGDCSGHDLRVGGDHAPPRSSSDLSGFDLPPTAEAVPVPTHPRHPRL